MYTKAVIGKRKLQMMFLTILMFIGLLAWGVPAAAQTKNIICNDYGKNYSIEFNSEYKKSTTEVVIKNATSGKMKLDITVKTVRTKTYPSDKLKQFSWNDFMVSREMSGYIVMEPGEEQTIEFSFRSDYAGQSSIRVTTSKATVSENGGTTFQAAKKIAVNSEEKGVIRSGDSGGIYQYARYFSFTTKERRQQTIVLAGERGKTVHASIYRSSDAAMKSPLLTLTSDDAEKRGSVWLNPGTYVIAVGFRKSPGMYASYRFQLGGRNYIPATGVSLTCNTNNLTIDSGITRNPKTFTFTATTIPANSDDKLSDILVGGNIRSDMYYIKGDVRGKNKATFTITYKGYRYTTGNNTIKVKTSNGLQSKGFSVFAKAGTPSVYKYFVYPNQIELYGVRGSGASGTYGVSVYLKSGNKWIKQKLQGNDSVIVKKLKPNTRYDFKLTEAAKRADGKWIEGKPLYRSIWTAKNTKPEVKSIKVSNVREDYTWKWMRYTSTSGKWYKSYYTRYRVTVTLKKKLPANQKMEIDGHLVGGKGNQYTINLSIGGRKKGKSTTLTLQTYSKKGNINSYSNILKKNIRLK